MTDWTAAQIPGVRPERPADPVTLPAPHPFGAPVLIADCTTPLAGETVLSVLMKRMMRQPGDSDAP